MGISCLLRILIMCSLKLLLAVFGCFLLVLPRCLGGQNIWTAEDEAKALLGKRDQQGVSGSTYPTISSRTYQRDQENQGFSNQFSYNQGSSNKDGVHELKNRSELEYNSTSWEDPSSIQTSLHRARCSGHCIVYQFCDYGGAVYCFKHGESYSDLNQWDNRISSVDMVNGCRLDVWEGHSYSGDTAKTLQSLSCLENKWDDVISSIKCRCGV